MGNSYNDAQNLLNYSNKNQIILKNSLKKNNNRDINNDDEKDIKKENLNSKSKSKNISKSLSTIKEERNSTIKSNENISNIDNSINNNSIINNKKEFEIKGNKDFKENEDKEKLNNINQNEDDKIKASISMKKTGINNKEEGKENNEQDSVKINQNLYEFVNNNYKYYHYDEQYVHKKPHNNQNISNTKFSLNNIDDTLSSQNTIYNTNNDAEFFFDYSNRDDNNTEYRNNNNKNNIFNNVIEYKYKPSNSSNNNNMKKLKNSKKYNQIKIYNKYNIESVTKIHQTNNNLLLVSSFLSNKNISNNINYKPHTSEKNRLFNSYTNEKNNNIHKNFSFKNASNNDDDVIIYQKKNCVNPFKENNKTKSIKNNINDIIMRIQNKYGNEYKNSINQIPLNTQSNNYNNFDLCNDYNYNLNEKQKMSELIEKIPNNDLKNEIMVLYQRIINYNNEIILSNKNTNFDYIITFSNNYILIDDKKFSIKKFDESKFKKLSLIKISLLSKKENIIVNEEIDNINLKSQNIIEKNQHNIIPKVETEIINNKNTENTTSISSKKNLKSTSNKKFELLSIDNNTWKKIINLNDVIINNDKIFPLTVIEKNNLKLANSEVLTRINSVNNIKRNYSTNCKTSHEKHANKSEIKEEKTSTSIDISINNNLVKDNNTSNKWNKFYIKSLKNEKIIFEKNMVKLLKVNNLINTIKNSKKNKNIVIKEDNLIMFPVICLLSKDCILLFKNKEKNNPLLKKNLNLIRKVMIFKKSYKYIVIIEFSDLNLTSTKNKENDENEKDKSLGLIIDKENYYKEFIGLLKQLIPNLIVLNLN